MTNLGSFRIHPWISALQWPWKSPTTLAVTFNLVTSWGDKLTDFPRHCLVDRSVHRRLDIYITANKATRKTHSPIWVLWCQKQVSWAEISNCIPQYTVGCNYISLPEIPASVVQVLILTYVLKGFFKGRKNYIMWYLNNAIFSKFSQVTPLAWQWGRRTNSA